MRKAAASEAGWYGVRCLYCHDQSLPTTYEERVTIWRAASLDDAIRLAEQDAAGYASDLDSEYLGLAQAYAMPDPPEAGREVFSLCRESELPPTQYLDAFFDTGHEIQQITPQ